MLNVKWVGFLFVLSGAAGIGFALVGEYRMRIQMLEQIRNMMHYINDMVLYESTALPEAFRKTARRMDKPLKEFLEKIAEQMEEFSGEDISFLWKNNAKRLIGIINKNDYVDFLECMQQTGFMDVKGQSQALRLYEEKVEKKLCRLLEQKEEKCRLYQTLGIMSGLFVCILLL